MMTALPVLLYVDDRPSTLTDHLLRRQDIIPMLLRFSSVLADLPPAHLQRTAGFRIFVYDENETAAANAKRFKDWQGAQGLEATHFLNPSEPRQQVSQAFARSLGLPSLSAEQVRWLRHKGCMKEKLAAIGFHVTPWRAAAAISDVTAFADRHGRPVIIKPAEGYACISTFRLDAPGQLDRLPQGPFEEYIVEKYIHSIEYECCALVYAGEVLDAYVSCFPAPPLQAADGAINGNISMGRCSLPGLDVRALVQAIVTGMGLDHGYLHMEFFLSDEGELTVGEVALRLAGCEIPANHGLAYGFNIFDALIDIHTGRRPPLAYTREKPVGDLLLPAKAGRIAYVTPLEELLALEGVIGGKLKVQKGETIEPRRASHSSSGFVHIEGDTVDEVLRKMKGVLDRYTLITENEPA